MSTHTMPRTGPTGHDKMEAARLTKDLGYLVTPEQVMADRLDQSTADVPAIDPDTGRPWGIDASGLDHRLPHPDGEDCSLELCSYCSSTHCGWFCEAMHKAHLGSDL